MLLVVTVPPHGLVLRRRPEDLGLTPDGELPIKRSGLAPTPVQRPPREVVRSASFWLLTAAFVLSAGVSVAATAAGQSYELALVGMAAVMVVAAAAYLGGELGAQPQRAGTATRGMHVTHRVD